MQHVRWRKGADTAVAKQFVKSICAPIMKLSLTLAPAFVATRCMQREKNCWDAICVNTSNCTLHEKFAHCI